MYLVWSASSPRVDPTVELDDLALADVYAYPQCPDGGSWLRANMVSSLDGAASVDGSSLGLSSAPDRRLLGVLRALSDVVIVGAETARSEDYGPTKVRTSLVERRRERGQPDAPRLALVSGSLALDPHARVFGESAGGRPIVITSQASPAERRRALASVAEVVVAGERRVDPLRAVNELRARGLTRQLTEGGPRWLGDLVAAGLVDDLALTLSPTLAGAGASRIVGDAPVTTRPEQPLQLSAVLRDGDTLFTHYRREER